MEKNNNTIEFNINFGGFYESMPMRIIEIAIASYFDKEDYDDVDDNDIDTIDINAMQIDYCEQWLEHYKEIIPFGVGFVGIDSPDYYNYETDKISVRIGTKRINELIDTLKHDYDFIEWLDDASQSYDGFNSWYQGFEQVITNKAVFMMYYTNYITEQNKETIEYFWDSIWPDIALLETVKS